jgi:hypothetical protein
METKKLTQEEIQEIKNLRDSFSNTYINIGVINTRYKELKADEERNFEILEQLKEEEQKIYQKLKNNYGEGTVDLNTGEFKSEN